MSARRARRLAVASLLLLVGSVVGPGTASVAQPIAPEEKPALEDPSRVLTWRAGDALQAAANPSTDELELVAFSTGCRFLDTRIAGGPFATGEFRDLSVRDADLPAGLGPCGVPSRAVAVQVSLSTLAGSPTGTGYARLGPGGVDPTATVLQFTKGEPVSVTTSSGLDDLGRVRLRSLGAGSGYVGDLLGYWQQPVWGRVSFDGVLLEGQGVTEVWLDTSYAGDYWVWLDRPVYPGCAAVATPESSNIRIFAFAVAEGIYFFDARAYSSDAEEYGGFSFTLSC